MLKEDQIMDNSFITSSHFKLFHEHGIEIYVGLGSTIENSFTFLILQGNLNKNGDELINLNPSYIIQQNTNCASIVESNGSYTVSFCNTNQMLTITYPSGACKVLNQILDTNLNKIIVVFASDDSGSVNVSVFFSKKTKMSLIQVISQNDEYNGVNPAFLVLTKTLDKKFTKI